MNQPQCYSFIMIPAKIHCKARQRCAWCFPCLWLSLGQLALVRLRPLQWNRGPRQCFRLLPRSPRVHPVRRPGVSERQFKDSKDTKDPLRTFLLWLDLIERGIFIAARIKCPTRCSAQLLPSLLLCSFFLNWRRLRGRGLEERLPCRDEAKRFKGARLATVESITKPGKKDNRIVNIWDSWIEDFLERQALDAFTGLESKMLNEWVILVPRCHFVMQQKGWGWVLW